MQGLERGRDSLQEWQKNLAGLKEAIRKEPECRIKLNAHLKEFATHVDVFARGDEFNVEHAEAIIEEQISELERAKSIQRFSAYMRRRLLSGRSFL